MTRKIAESPSVGTLHWSHLTRCVAVMYKRDTFPATLEDAACFDMNVGPPAIRAAGQISADMSSPLTDNCITDIIRLKSVLIK